MRRWEACEVLAGGGVKVEVAVIAPLRGREGGEGVSAETFSVSCRQR
jgi:hypothetical protein